MRDDQLPMIKYESIYVSPWAASLEEEEDHKRCLARFDSVPKPNNDATKEAPSSAIRQ